MSIVVKHVGLNGQISLGKEYADRQISITKLENGNLLLKLGRFIPDSEMWLYANGGEERVDKAIDWHSLTKRRDNYDEIIEKLSNA